ncbi:hypothetical protein [Sorangium cellulosum]|jgi:hypothetical protein|nr:hypothetical protein [Sorangium cellulosum]
MMMKKLGTAFELVVCAGAALGLTACLGADASYEPIEPLGSQSSEILAGGPDDQVVLYDLPGFSGDSQSFGIGRYDIEALAIDNRASSIRVPAGLRVTAFANPEFGPEAHVFTSDVAVLADVGPAVDNFISSLVVAHASDPQLDAVTFYKDADFSGDSFTFGVGANLLFASPWTPWEAQISSVRVPPGFKVTLSTGWITWYDPETLVLTEDADLADHNFDDKTLSFMVERL